jgi:hypothetical protein
MREFVRKPTTPPSRDEKIEFIFDRLFPDILIDDLEELERKIGRNLTVAAARQSLLERAGDGETSWDERTTVDDFEAALVRIGELRQMSDDDLNALYDTEKEQEQQETRAKAASEDEHRFFNKPAAQANFSIWLQKAYWTVDEATALCLGKDPQTVNWKAIQPLLRASPFAAQYRDVRDLITRAVEAGTIGDRRRISPSRLATWSHSHGLPYLQTLQLT